MVEAKPRWLILFSSPASGQFLQGFQNFDPNSREYREYIESVLKRVESLKNLGKESFKSEFIADTFLDIFSQMRKRQEC